MAAISSNFLVVLVAEEGTGDTRVNDKKTYGLPHESSLFIASCSGETGYMRRLTRAFTAILHKAWM